MKTPKSLKIKQKEPPSASRLSLMQLITEDLGVTQLSPSMFSSNEYEATVALPLSTAKIFGNIQLKRLLR